MINRNSFYIKVFLFLHCERDSSNHHHKHNKIYVVPLAELQMIWSTSKMYDCPWWSLMTSQSMTWLKSLVSNLDNLAQCKNWDEQKLEQCKNTLMSGQKYHGKYSQDSTITVYRTNQPLLVE